MNSYTSLSTTTEYGASKTVISLKRGVKQWDPLSPFIIIAIIDLLLERLEQMKGYVFDESLSLSVLAFANDLILLPATKDKVQSLLHDTECALRLRSAHPLKSGLQRVRGTSTTQAYAYQTAIRYQTWQQIAH